MSHIVREFKSDRPYLKFEDYDEAFEKCIEMYLESGRERTFYVSGETIPKRKVRAK